MATTPSRIKRLYEFGPFRLDPQKRLLLREETPVSLTPKAVETLMVLVQNHGRIVSKDELMKTLWPDSFVEESNLSQNIFVLRKALGDSNKKRYILTAAGRGYQFAEEVREVGELEEEEALVVETRSRSELLATQTETRAGWVWAGVGALILAVAGGGFLAYRARHHGGSGSQTTVAPTPAIKLRRSVAVLDFRNLTQRPEDRWLSTALAEMLRTELAEGDQLRLVPGDQIAQAVPDFPRTGTTLSKDSLDSLRTNLETDYVAFGDYTVVGEGNRSQIRLDFRLLDSAQGKVVAQDKVIGHQSDLFTLILQAGTSMREHLTVGATSTEQEKEVRASLPANAKAARLYAEGLMKLREFEGKIAADLLSQAVAADPKSAEAHAALGSAWQALGYDSKAIDETHQALALAKNLRAEERLSIEGQYRRLNHEWPKAIDIYRTLIDLYPDNLDYALRLAQAQQTSGAGKEGLATLAAARNLPSPLGSDPRIDIAEAGILIDQADYKKAQAVAAQAIEKGKQSHARLVLAQALRAESTPLIWLGENARARTDLAEAKVLFAAAGDLRNSAVVVHITGRIAYNEGNFEEARKHYQESLLIFRQIGNRPAMVRSMEAIGNVYYEEGKLLEAKRQYEETLAIDRELGSKLDICSALGNIANVLDGLGRLADAEKAQEQALQLFKEVGDKRGAATTEHNLATVLIEQGELAKAEQHYRLALTLSNETGHKAETASDMLGLADVSYHRDSLKDARDKAEQSLALRKELGSTVEIAYSRVSMARISLEQGQAAEAEKSASDAVHQLENANVPESLASANSVLALALLGEGRATDAQAATLRALTLAAKTSVRSPKFDAGLAAARVDMAAGKFADARNKVKTILAQASENGFLAYIFEARLALGEIALKTGQSATARAQLTTLENDARTKGFLRVARKAARLAGS